MTKPREKRAFEFDVRAEQDDKHGTHLAGVPIVFGQETDLGWYSETIDAHALDNTDLRDVRFLVNHNIDMIPLARSRNNNENSTMQLLVTDEGMRIRVDLDTESNTDAKALYSAVKRGDISGMSFMFAVEEDAWDGLDTDHPHRTIMAISRVFEVSAVTWPAYEQTSLEAASMTLESAREALESARRSKAHDDRIARIRALLSEEEPIT